MSTALRLAAATVALSSAVTAQLSDAPTIVFDPAAQVTDVYAFVTQTDGAKTLTTALNVFPFQDPGNGPNLARFDDDVMYEIHVSLGDDLAKGEATLSYRFLFETEIQLPDTILSSYFGSVFAVGDAAQNLVQRYEVTRVDHRLKGKKKTTELGDGIVPPNNQGLATPFYNTNANADLPAVSGATTDEGLDPYTQQAVAALGSGHRAFAGQRDDGMYANLQGVFDGLAFHGVDDLAGFNVHTIALEIPIDDLVLGGDMQQVGVFGTASRRRTRIVRGEKGDKLRGRWTQVSRAGNPLVDLLFVPTADKNRFQRTAPGDFAAAVDFFLEPELALLMNVLLGVGAIPEERDDLAAILFPDVLRVDLSTPPTRLAGGPAFGLPDDAGFSRLGIFDPITPDTLTSRIQPGLFGDGEVSGGFPNGRRFGDDVLDVTLSLLASDLRDPTFPFVNTLDGIDAVSANDAAYNKVFPYAATPHNGRTHEHH